MANIKFKNMKKIYDNGFEAVKDFNLEIHDHEFVIFVGPSGCGKTTTLRMIAGLEEISGGELWIDDKLVNDVEPKDRDIAMVFQNYALYPHMTIYDNMAFALKIQKVPKAEIAEKIKSVAKILNLESQLEKKPKELSGGQRQRVAMGRAIVREPKVFLMDEPLSNLDAKLRVSMRAELAALHQRLNATIVYVTHDQTEAMTLGTRIVVMKDGDIMQVDGPQDLYNKPNNLFVAGFIGSPQMNFMDVKCTVDGDKVFVSNDDVKIELPADKAAKAKLYDGKTIVLGIRPDDVTGDPKKVEKYSGSVINTTIFNYELLGSEVIVYFKLKESDMAAKLFTTNFLQRGDAIKVAIIPEKIHLFDKETELTITN